MAQNNTSASYWLLAMGNDASHGLLLLWCRCENPAAELTDANGMVGCKLTNCKSPSRDSLSGVTVSNDPHFILGLALASLRDFSGETFELQLTLAAPAAEGLSAEYAKFSKHFRFFGLWRAAPLRADQAVIELMVTIFSHPPNSAFSGRLPGHHRGCTSWIGSLHHRPVVHADQQFCSGSGCGASVEHTVATATFDALVRQCGAEDCGQEELVQCTKPLQLLSATSELSFVTKKEELDQLCPLVLPAEAQNQHKTAACRSSSSSSSSCGTCAVEKLSRGEPHLSRLPVTEEQQQQQQHSSSSSKNKGVDGHGFSEHDLHAGLHCIRSYTRRCMNIHQRDHFNKLYHGTNEVIHELCEEGSYQEGTYSRLSPGFVAYEARSMLMLGMLFGALHRSLECCFSLTAATTNLEALSLLSAKAGFLVSALEEKDIIRVQYMAATFICDFLRHAPCMRHVKKEYEVCATRYQSTMSKIGQAAAATTTSTTSAAFQYHIGTTMATHPAYSSNNNGGGSSGYYPGDAGQQHQQHHHHHRNHPNNSTKHAEDAEEERLKTVCCAFQRYMQCSEFTVRQACGDQTALFTRRFLDKMSDTLMRMHCVDYTPESGKCRDYFSSSARPAVMTANGVLVAAVAASNVLVMLLLLRQSSTFI
ncbi:hypothetical protein AND_010090 [Anopheles darlingi]|uniref:Uncharacterized protein n=1 Tax=Anopheles darlingi TaxID=43151 RepID=W5J4I5_ANODA|nr:hypothetical protein AND_010090 [Anopheles darlingi]